MTAIGALVADRCFETSSTTGTGPRTLAGAQPGFRGIATTFGNGGVGYFCETDDVDWQVFKGTVTVGGSNTLSIDTVYGSSNGGAAVNWGAGTRNVFSVAPAALLNLILDAGFRPHAESTPAMTVRLEAGKVWNGTTLTAVAAQSTAAITAPIGNPRLDRVVIDQASGAVSVITGTPAGSPAAPAITAGKIPVAQILLQPGSTVITDSMITDERMLTALGQGSLGFQNASGLTVAVNEAKGADTPSATTTSIDAIVGNYGHVTGTVAITGLGTAAQAGERRTIYFTGAVPLTNGANLVIPGGNYTTAAGDIFTFRADTTTVWVVESYSLASGKPLKAASGSIAQTVRHMTGAYGADLGAQGTTTIPYDDTIPQNTEGDQYLSQVITPSNSSSTLEIDVVLMGSSVNASAYLIVALFQDSGAGAIASTYIYNGGLNNGGFVISFRYAMTAGTTSATTFKVRAGSSTGNTNVNGDNAGRKLGGTMVSSITIREILP